jgi:hypothetical protein
MGIGLPVQVVTMSTASLIENRRLDHARSHGLDKTVDQLPPTIFALLPQFVLMGLADAFLVVGKIELFYEQAPQSMKSLGTAMSLLAYGVGNVLSSFLLSLVTRITRERGNAWVSNNLNASNLDYYCTTHSSPCSPSSTSSRSLGSAPTTGTGLNPPRRSRLLWACRLRKLCLGGSPRPDEACCESIFCHAVSCKIAHNLHMYVVFE